MAIPNAAIFGIVYDKVLLVIVGVASVLLTLKEPVTKEASAGIASVNGRLVKGFKPTLVITIVWVKVSPILAVSLSTDLRSVGARRDDALDP